jgi:hypothetical protein
VGVGGNCRSDSIGFLLGTEREEQPTSIVNPFSRNAVPPKRRYRLVFVPEKAQVCCSGARQNSSIIAGNPEEDGFWNRYRTGFPVSLA